MIFAAMLRFLSIVVRIRKSTLLLFTKHRSKSLTHFRFLNQETHLEKTDLINDSSSLTTTVSYLINSCGLSPQSALSASKKINIKTTMNPDSVINIFKSYGFTNTQIEKIIISHPKFLLSNHEKTIKRKLDYYLDIGFSVTELAQFIFVDPVLLKASLEKRLKPNFKLLNSIIGNTRQIAVALRHTTRLLTNNLENDFLPNVRILQSCGVPDPNITKLVTTRPRVVMQATEQFAAIISSVKKYGFNPLSALFVQGVAVMSGHGPSSWERKVAVYKSLGWSEGEVISAFTKQPFCIALSEETIRRRLDFFAKKLQWEPSFLAAHPILLCFSSDKRVIPRCSVMSVLASKGLVRGYPGPGYQFLLLAEKQFLNKYVTKYQDQVPEVLEAYKGGLESGI